MEKLMSQFYSNKRSQYEKIFFERVKEVHGDRYILNKTKYTGMNKWITATCRLHGDFKMKATNFSLGHNCPCCSKISLSRKHKNCKKRNAWLKNNSDNQRRTLDSFLTQAFESHGKKYDYSKVDYKNNLTEVEIICPEHGNFWQKPVYHINGKHGCPKCGNNFSVKENLWLDNFKNIDKRQHRIYYNGRRYYQVDGIDLDTNTVYEFLGDYWHGNPAKYKKGFINKRCSKSMGELYEETMSRIAHLTELGFNVEYIWEHDFENS